MRRPARKAPKKEISLHMTVAGFLRYAWPGDLPWFHVPNGEKRDPATAGKLKAMGVKAGVPDFLLHMPNGQVAYLELKVGDNGLSEDQINFRAQVMALGCGYAVARTLDEAEAKLGRWLGLYGRKLNATTRRAA